MSQTTDQASALENIRKAKKDLVKSGKSAGPTFSLGGSSTSFWHDQVFERDFTPAGSVQCSQPLRVGQNAQGLYIALNASASNSEAVTFPADSTVTFTFSVADDEEGEYKNIGPTVCVKAPEEGITGDPGDTLCRVALGDFPLPWLRVQLDFSGSISGGNLTCGLGYAAR